MDGTSQVPLKNFQSAKSGQVSQKPGGQVRHPATKTAGKKDGGQGLIFRSLLRYIVWL